MTTLTVRCPTCGATNRVPSEKIERGLRPSCGRCKNLLSLDAGHADGAPEGRPVKVTDATFASEVEHSPLPVVVDLWAEWCGPCRMIAPVIDELASQMAGRIRFAKLNIDENPQTANRFGVRSIPTLLVMRNGVEVDRIVGAVPKTEIQRRVAQATASTTP